ncbi:MAG: iron uptake porin [Leptolyngbyaceae cyanobacterium SU_3_3]|nr:iron uptake porin [Leptolyngbyaceae cyanobacterium SU_3_3]NJR49615.1 iron uptake porin [Leptolyngbyaceae cyanobacterium CSU_1_3]
MRLNSIGIAALLAIVAPVNSETLSVKNANATPKLAESSSLNTIAEYAKGNIHGDNAKLNQVDQYVDESSKNAAIATHNQKLQNNNPILSQLDRYAYEGSEDQALDIQINRNVGLTELDKTSTLDWAFDTSDVEADQATTQVSQVTSVSQLVDVRPTDWAFTALQSLVEQYGCIAGYPDRSFRGNLVLTRFEFAAGLNACLDRINELAVTATSNLVAKEDFVALEKLQAEFGVEIAAIKGRVDGLETRTRKLETERFSFTSKLFGLAYFNYSVLSNADDLLRETGFRSIPAGANVRSAPLTQRVKNPNATSSGLAWLTLGSSFTGKDLLLTQLAMGQGISPANYLTSATSTINSTGIPFTDAGAYLGPGAPVVLRELAYEFPVLGNGRLAIGPRINWFRFFDANPFTFFLTGTSSLNSIAGTLTNDVRRGAGAVLVSPLSPKLDLRLGYLAEGNEYSTQNLAAFNSASSVEEGLFGGTNSLTVELTYKPDPVFNFRIMYSRANSRARTQFLDNQVPVTSPVKLVSGAPINGLADDGFGGGLEDAQSNIFQVNFDWLINRRVGIFGRYGFADTRLNAQIDSRSGNINTQSFQFGFTVLDLFKRGAQGTLSFVMPFNYTKGRDYLVSGAGDGGIQYELEGVYFYPVTNNIAIVPNVQVIFNANNFSSNPTIAVFNIRTQFSF